MALKKNKTLQERMVMAMTTKVVGIFLDEGFHDEEVKKIISGLRTLGVRLVGLLASADNSPDNERTFVLSEKGEKAPVKPLTLVRGASLDAVIIPPHKSVEEMRGNKLILGLLLEMDCLGKPIGAIGNGVKVLSSAGLIAGRRVTSISKKHAEKDYATLVEQPLVVDRHIITCNADDVECLSHFVNCLAFLLESEPAR